MDFNPRTSPVMAGLDPAIHALSQAKTLKQAMDKIAPPRAITHPTRHCERSEAIHLSYRGKMDLKKAP
jgi:hypothetical protein